MLSKLMCDPKQDMISVLSSHQISVTMANQITGGNGGGGGTGENNNDDVTKG